MSEKNVLQPVGQKKEIVKNDKKISTGKKVRVITGSDRGVIGEVLKVFPKKKTAIVSKVNIATVHIKATNSSPGRIDRKELPIHISNLVVVNDSI